MKQLLVKPLQIFFVGLVGLFCLATIVHFSFTVIFRPVTQIDQPIAVLPAPAVSERFPVSVDPVKKTIVDSQNIDTYVEQYLSINVGNRRRDNFISKLYAKLARIGLYQQLASSISRVLVIYPGQRKEEIAKDFSDILHWTPAEHEEFLALMNTSEPYMTEGKFYPGHYTVAKTATPAEVTPLLLNKFETEILVHYDDVVAAQVPLGTALTIASLLEREAYDFTDMRIISGIIWNRLFIGMPLQLDATLQYVRGSEPTERKWWPMIKPADKFIDSPYNTYQTIGLPPAPIANASVEAVVAALNPVNTTCLFYFHEDDGTFHCTDSYEEHVALLKQIYGRGK